MIFQALAVVSLLQCMGACGTPLTNADLRLESTVTPRRIVAGEFVKIRTTWTARHRIKEPVEYGWVEIDRGAGFQPHEEALQGWSCSVSVEELRAGGSFVTEHVVGLARRDAPAGLSGLDAENAGTALAFDRPGRYRVRFRHDDALSDPVEIEVVAPAGDGARLLAILRERPIVLSWYARMEEPIRAEGMALVATFGRHRLLQPFLDQVEGRAFDPVRRVERRGGR